MDPRLAWTIFPLAKQTIRLRGTCQEVSKTWIGWHDHVDSYAKMKYKKKLKLYEPLEIYDSLEIRESFEIYESFKQESYSKNYSKHSFRLIRLNQIYAKLMVTSRRIELRNRSNSIRSSVIKIQNQKELTVKYTKVQTIKILI